MRKKQAAVILVGLILILLISTSCAPGNTRYEDKRAGFFAGLWHGIICPVTFIISLFNKSVGIYELNNSGGWYNFGFVLGVAIIFSGSSSSSCKKKKKKSAREQEWEEIAGKVEEKVRRGIKNWVDEPEKKEDDWEEIGKKIEEKIKRELSKWAEK